jgi:hypothetical protein
MSFVISLFSIAAFLAGATTGVITVVMVGIRRDDRAKTLTGIPRTPAEAATRRMLGVGVRNGNADSWQSPPATRKEVT